MLLYPTTTEDILILVKTYPQPSEHHIETVCTAGIRRDGTWVRLYPVAFRTFQEYQQYSKYQWVQCGAYKNGNDARPESLHLDEAHPLTLGKKIEIKNNDDQTWNLRREVIFSMPKIKIFTDMTLLKEMAHRMQCSLAVFKPKEILGVECHRVTAEESKKYAERQRKAENQERQEELTFYNNTEWKNGFRHVKQLPYNFSYRFLDEHDVSVTLRILDWELGALYNNYVKDGAPDTVIIEKVKQKYMSYADVRKYDVHFYLGTVLASQMRNYPNPWQVIGVAGFRPKSYIQDTFL